MERRHTHEVFLVRSLHVAVALDDMSSPSSNGGTQLVPLVLVRTVAADTLVDVVALVLVRNMTVVLDLRQTLAETDASTILIQVASTGSDPVLLLNIVALLDGKGSHIRNILARSEEDARNFDSSGIRHR